MADWIPVAALGVSALAAVIAFLSYQRAGRVQRDAHYGEVAAFAAAIRRKTVLEAPDTPGWDAYGVNESVLELLDAAMESCVRLLAAMRTWSLDEDRARTDIQQIPEAHAAVTNWVAEMRAELAVLDSYSDR